MQDEILKLTREVRRLREVIGGEVLCDICCMDLGAACHWGDRDEEGNHPFVWDLPYEEPEG